ncbi:DgyrCDS1587 [Dimorphilus gyrociliatus]|nr:DgyrCDS1587 [Dimorphilus gyrociliatus]
MDEYTILVEKFSTVKKEFERNMEESANRFQQLEETHLKSMGEFLQKYSEGWSRHYDKLKKTHDEFDDKCSSLSIEALLDMFVTTKKTGTDRPSDVTFEQPDLSGISAMESSTESDRPERPKSTTFLDLVPAFGRRRKKKAEEKDNNSLAQTQVDEEGFTVRPDEGEEKKEDLNSWWSSGEESDEEETKTSKKPFKVEIKPANINGSGGTESVTSMEDLKRSVVQLKNLAPPPSRRPDRMTPTPNIFDSQNQSDEWGHRKMTSISSSPHLQIPVAFAITETVNALFDADCYQPSKIRIDGQITVCLPRSVAEKLISDSHPLIFNLQNATSVQKIDVDNNLISIDLFKEKTYSFKMSALCNYVKGKLVENNVNYINIDVLKYEVESMRAPFLIRSVFNKADGYVDVVIEVTSNVSNALKCSGDVKLRLALCISGSQIVGVESKPAYMTTDNAKVVWNLEYNEKCFVEAKIKVEDNLYENNEVCKCRTALQFHCDGASVSGSSINIQGEDFKLAKMVNRVSSGKYASDAVEPSIPEGYQ